DTLSTIPTRHEDIGTLFNQHFSSQNPLFQPYGSYLDEGLEARLLADYHHGDKATLAKARQQAKRAQVFLDLAKHYLTMELATVS
ncbi:MAG: hypothetical protein F6K65_39270, partial [Moorea sp. SIO3C2]|nr:hypothetical protein [Moorena sp. SIO3C2]